MAITAFQSVIKNRALDRNFGGTGASIVADPYISGYHFCKWAKLPDKLFEYVKSGDGAVAGAALGDEASIKAFLEGSTLSVTNPGGTINKTEFVGLGGVKWSVPTNVDYGTSVTVKYLEFASTPVLSIFHAWARLIRSYKSGLTSLQADDGTYTKSAYTGSMLYWTTQPDGKTVEYSAAFTGMFPLKDPQDLYTGDLTAVDKLEVDIEFSIDWVWHEDWVHTACQSAADEIHKQGKSVDGYRDDAGKDKTVSG